MLAVPRPLLPSSVNRILVPSINPSMSTPIKKVDTGTSTGTSTSTCTGKTSTFTGRTSACDTAVKEKINPNSPLLGPIVGHIMKSGSNDQQDTSHFTSNANDTRILSSQHKEGEVNFENAITSAQNRNILQRVTSNDIDNASETSAENQPTHLLNSCENKFIPKASSAFLPLRTTTQSDVKFRSEKAVGKTSPIIHNISGNERGISRENKNLGSDKSSQQLKQSLDQSSGRWTKEEHEEFLAGLKVFGREWKKVAQRIPTRTSAQIRSHAQKYFAKLARDEEQQQQVAASASLFHGINSPSASNCAPPLNAEDVSNLSPFVLEKVGKILKEPKAVQREVEETLKKLRARYNQLQQEVENRQKQRQDHNGNPTALRPHDISIKDTGKQLISITNPSRLNNMHTSSTNFIKNLKHEIKVVNQIPMQSNNGGLDNRKRSYSTGIIDTKLEGCKEIDKTKKMKNNPVNIQATNAHSIRKKEMIALRVLGGELFQSCCQKASAQMPSQAYLPVQSTTRTTQNKNIAHTNQNEHVNTRRDTDEFQDIGHQKNNHNKNDRR